VYALVDPRDGEVRYVGWAYDVEQRWRAGHRTAARRTIDKKSLTHQINWLREMMRAGYDAPIVEVLSVWLTAAAAKAEERRVITTMRGAWPLTNMTDGGDGFSSEVSSLGGKVRQARWDADERHLWAVAAGALGGRRRIERWGGTPEQREWARRGGLATAPIIVERWKNGGTPEMKEQVRRAGTASGRSPRTLEQLQSDERRRISSASGKATAALRKERGDFWTPEWQEVCVRGGRNGSATRRLRGDYAKTVTAGARRARELTTAKGAFTAVRRLTKSEWEALLAAHGNDLDATVKAMLADADIPLS
jgi:hypothetical protein